ncbi:lipopolysaccharide export system protein LptA [Marinobacter daqiaonensis]|uniref:Lipopolysaccharide export system protein LptA n=1 Tax=Marinobacter daqiaonensis TaxID=650891 RepID=A0A1I6HC05_9GAMM|nr:lipopolysaccharide transport periplasmic protein LptA [Marinobacter daqiaonensis]SFR51890.1 lipopolysaccharide export system protein LptA [Marinobacter daqiaonensis]
MKPAHKLAGQWLMIPALLALASGHAAAFDLDAGQPIRVSADSARLDDSQGVAIYQGNVRITQGETRITADRVELYRDADGLDRIAAKGQPATYHQPATDNQSATDARARLIYYFADDSRLRFEEEAVVEQGGNEFRGAIIDYNTANRVVTAEGRTPEGEGSGRVEMVIQPRQGADSPAD